MAAYLSSLSLLSLVGRLPASIAQGLIWGIMALGVYVTFRLLNIADLSVDGTFTTGGAVAVMLIINNVNPVAATFIATLAGLISGLVTGLMHTKLGIPAILSGILTQYALYSINLAIMGFKANQAVSVDRYYLVLSSRYPVPAIVVGGIVSVGVLIFMYWFFGTEMGSALRATGCNQTMAKAQGININTMKVLGLSFSNGLVALSGALSAQYSGFSDVNSGRGAIVIGIAAVIIGEVLREALFRKNLNFAITLGFVIFGGIIYYFVYTLVLWLKLDPNLMKMFTAIIVAIFLAVPYLKAQARNSFGRAGKNALRKGIKADA